MSNPGYAKCRGCQKTILWAKDENGKAIPLDAVAPVYKLLTDGTCMRVKTGFVTHFATCADANKFGKDAKVQLPPSGDELDAIWQAVTVLRTLDEQLHMGLASQLATFLERYAPGPKPPEKVQALLLEAE